MRLTEEELRRRRRERILIVVAAVAIAVTTFLEVRLGQFATGLPLGNHLLFFSLININVILTLLLGFLVFRNLAKLLFDRRKDRLGVKLRTKLVVAFIAFTLAPTILLFSVSAGFVVNSMDKWFGPRVEKSFEEALEVATAYYQRAEDDAELHATQIAAAIAAERAAGHAVDLDAVVAAKREEYNLGMVEVFSDGLAEISRAVDPNAPVTSFSSADGDFIGEALAGRTAGRVQSVAVPGENGSTDTADVIRGIAPIREADGVTGAVVVNYYVPVSLTAKMAGINSGVREFQQLQDYLSPIRSSYILILATITLLVLFSATWLGFYLSREITDPLKDLADATRAVAGGNLQVRIPEGGADEIGVVVAGFNRMTEHLLENRAELETAYGSLQASSEESERRRRYLETLLRNVAAGVIALDAEGHVRAINDAAAALLSVEPSEMLGKGYRDLLPDDLVGTAIEMVREARTAETATREMNVSLNGHARTVVVSVTALKDDEGQPLGLVAVLDDLTELVKAQRVAAWREVARRIAHEVKNPLTPIQLSAQRLRRRFRSRLQGDEDVFDECTETIVRQVDELKRLVSEFSEFARLPEANPTPNDLNATVGEAVALYRDVHPGIDVSFEPADNVPVFDLDREQIKRVAINLLDNAVAAINEGSGQRIDVSTSFQGDLRIARIEVADDGPGIEPEVRDRLFEPYFSTRKDGTGLGLAIVRRIVTDHDGFIRVQDNDPRGTRFIVELPVKRPAGRITDSEETAA